MILLENVMKTRKSVRRYDMIIGCMMTLNNEAYVENAIKSLSLVSDRIVIVDGGSSDSTIDICKNYTDEIIISKWIGNHSAQRNVYLRYIKHNYPDSWCFNLDSDETIDQSKANVISGLCATKTARFYWFRRKWLVNVDPITYISSAPHFPDWQLRLFKVSHRTEYNGLIHENLTGRSIFNKIRGIPYVKLLSRKITDLDIWHLDLVLNSFDRRREKVQKYEKMERDSGGRDYYLPEDFNTNISVIHDPEAKLIINEKIMKITAPNRAHWDEFLKAKTNAS